MTTNTPSIDRFVDELRAVYPQGAEFVEQVRTGLMDIDRKADDCPDHAAFFAGLQWIYEHESHPVAERLEQMSKLANFKKGYVVVDLPEFTGWR
jgi:hypothetical protein